MKAIEDAIGYLETLPDTTAGIIADELKLLLPTPRRSRSQDDDLLSDTWEKFRLENPEYWDD